MRGGVVETDYREGKKESLRYKSTSSWEHQIIVWRGRAYTLAALGACLGKRPSQIAKEIKTGTFEE
jgi:hypothetical protein